LLGYAVIYTGFLKRATPQNIVIADWLAPRRRCWVGWRLPGISALSRCCWC
jgi:heme O synthase-like polyprenyltransferase